MELNPLHIQNLPLEIQLEILSKLNREELLNLCKINILWRNLCRDELLWRNLVFQDFGNIHELGNSWYETYKDQYDKIKDFINVIFVNHKLKESIEVKYHLIDKVIDFVRNNNHLRNKFIDEKDWNSIVFELFTIFSLNIRMNRFPYIVNKTKLFENINTFLKSVYHPNIIPDLAINFPHQHVLPSRPLFPRNNTFFLH